MEQKLVRVPFDLELAKKIMNKECEGRIVTRDRRSVRIICFDAHCDNNIVALIEDEKGIEYPKSYVSDGMVFLTGSSGCDLMLEIPKYMAFKDGDVLSNGDGFVFILDGHGDCKTSLYVGIYLSGDLTFGGAASFDDIDLFKFATEEERRRLIDALKVSQEPKAQEYFKRFFGIEEKPKCEFKPFDKVLVKNDENEEWNISLFARKIMNYSDGLTYEYECCNGILWNYCIPFEGNEHLLADKIVTD